MSKFPPEAVFFEPDTVEYTRCLGKAEDIRRELNNYHINQLASGAAMTKASSTPQKKSQWSEHIMSRMKETDGHQAEIYNLGFSSKLSKYLKTTLKEIRAVNGTNVYAREGIEYFLKRRKKPSSKFMVGDFVTFYTEIIDVKNNTLVRECGVIALIFVKDGILTYRVVLGENERVYNATARGMKLATKKQILTLKKQIAENKKRAEAQEKAEEEAAERRRALELKADEVAKKNFPEIDFGDFGCNEPYVKSLVAALVERFGK